MEQLIDDLTRGNVTEVKVVLATVILALAAVVATMCVAYYGFDEGGAHPIVACVLLGLLATKVLVVRLGGRRKRSRSSARCSSRSSPWRSRW